MSRSEIRGLYDSILAMVENGINAGLKAKIINAISAFLDLMDSNSDHRLSREEILVFSKKVVETFFAYYAFLVNSAKVTPSFRRPLFPHLSPDLRSACFQTMVKGTLPSAVGLLFDVKAQLVGGDTSGLSKDEVSAAFAKYEAAAYPSRTRLHWEALRGNASLVTALVRKGGVDLNARDEDGKTALHLAAQYSHREVVLELINSKADVNAESPDGRSALDLAELHAAEWKASTRMWENEAVKEMLKRHFCNGWSPLMVEAEKGDVPALQGLVAQRADVRARNKAGASALHYAASPAVAQVLLGAGADLHAFDADRRTPLHYAAADGRLAVIQFLLDSRASMDLRDANGNRPLEAAGSVCRLRLLTPFNYSTS